MGSPVVSGDLANEPRFHDRFLCGLGVRGALTVPLHENKAPFGTLGVYCRRPRQFNPDDVQFAETIAHLLASSIARVKAEEALQQQRSLAAALLDVADSLLIVLNAEGMITDINQSCRQATGFDLERILGKPLASVFVPPEDSDLFHGMFHGALRSRSPCQFESSLLTKSGQRLQVAWSLRVTCDLHGEPQAVLLSGVRRAEQAPQTFAVRPSGKGGIENRSSPRRVFQYRQLIAPVLGNAMPSERDFFEVDCSDISAGGLSFYLGRVPEFDKLIVRLGKAPALTHFAAQVVRYMEKVEGPQRQYLVGCRFLGRVHL
jgi:PAS domain S-box-containing protein